MHKYDIAFSELGLTTEDILSEMGYGKVQPDEELRQHVAELLDEISRVSRPSCELALYPVTVLDDGLLVGDAWLGDVVKLATGETIASLMQGISQVAIFVATAGGDFEAYQHRIKERDDIIQTFIADTIGSAIAERAGDRAERHLEQVIGPALQHTHRFSPGYCGWRLAEQSHIFSLLEPDPCGITLSDVSLMTPIKSISGFIGIGLEVNRKQYGCQFCELEHCYKKRLRGA